MARRRHLAENTIDVYRQWIKRFLTFSALRSGGWKRPEELGTSDVELFLNDLVIDRRLSASSQNGLVFLYGRVLRDTIPQDHLGKFLLERSRRVKRVPTVLSTDEVRRVIGAAPFQQVRREAMAEGVARSRLR